MDFEAICQTKSIIALNHFREYTPDHIGLKVVPAAQTNTNNFFLFFLSNADSQTHGIYP